MIEFCKIFIIFIIIFGETMEKIKEAAWSFAEVTGIPVTCFDAKGEILWGHNRVGKVCDNFGLYTEQGGACRNSLLNASRTAAQIGEPYVFLCRAGLLKIAFSLIIDKKVAGCLMAGPILVGELKESIFDNIVNLNGLSVDSYSKVLVALKDIKEYKPEEVVRLSALFGSCILGGLTPNSDYLKIVKHHQEMQKIAESMQKYKRAKIPAPYSYEIEAILQQDEKGHYSGRSQIIKLAVGYIHENYKEKISLKTIAEKLHTNSSYLSMLFKQETRVTVTDYISQIRIEKSCELLSETTLSFSDIAARTGFEDQSYFSKVFKKIHGVTPTEYRKGR